MLHELSLWLAARALKVRVEGALRIPDEADISELRLSVIRLAPDTGPVKLALIALCPLASGLAALWAISMTLIPGDAVTLALPGSVTELGAAIHSLTRTANFWLWLYIVFTIANRSFPSLPLALSMQRTSLLMLALMTFLFGIWRASDAVSPAISLDIEWLLSGLLLIMAQITLLNMACVLLLGALEALIERITGRSATFRDGRMITLDSGETTLSQSSPTREQHQAVNAPATRQAAPAKSIYDLKLPIPGPPGREPVSRQAVTVVNLDQPASADQEIAARPKPQPSIPRRPADKVETGRVIPDLMSDKAVSDSRPAAPNHDAAAPFARPFIERAAPASAPDAWDEASDAGADEPFARPFVMPTRSGQPVSAGESFDSEADTAAAGRTEVDSGDTEIHAETERDPPRRRSIYTRPAPKPSRKANREIDSAKSLGPDELVYEDLDEIEAYDSDDGPYDEEL